ncbi:hypothetical protein KUTeg_007026 [Tegillarca granosa]|uniref:DUF4371 domain-containing protein n=1 Tax=Tegillarca granosa TaxID=220873 RepID=A0ABQ9FF94_TEGGR|nr:hypothetical protein KUTeg_007026 [Tegillarca granosa]
MLMPMDMGSQLRPPTMKGIRTFALAKKFEGETKPMKQHCDSIILKEDKQIFTYLNVHITKPRKNCQRTNSDGNLKYCSHAALTEFQIAIGDVIIEDKTSRIKSSHYFSLTVDESTDIGNKKRLLMYISYLENHQVKTELFDNIHISTSSANAGTATDNLSTL